MSEFFYLLVVAVLLVVIVEAGCLFYFAKKEKDFWDATKRIKLQREGKKPNKSVAGKFCKCSIISSLSLSIFAFAEMWLEHYVINHNHHPNLHILFIIIGISFAEVAYSDLKKIEGNKITCQYVNPSFAIQFALVHVVSLWYNSMQMLYIGSNRIFTCKTGYKLSLVTNTVIKHGARCPRRYHVTFNPICFSKNEVESIRKPYLTCPNKIAVDALPYLSGAKLFESNKLVQVCDIYVRRDDYQRAGKGNMSIRYDYQIGYNGLIFNDYYQFQRTADLQD